MIIARAVPARSPHLAVIDLWHASEKIWCSNDAFFLPVRAPIEGHQTLLRIQEEYLSSGKDVAHINLAKLAGGGASAVA
jgi:hypothetical protein